MPFLQISERRVGDVTVLELEGRLILESGEIPLRDCVDRLVSEGRVNLVVDLSKVTQLDSAGVGMLVSKYLTALRKGGRIKLLHLTAKATQLMGFTRLRTVFEIFETEEAAVASFAQSAPRS